MPQLRKVLSKDRETLVRSAYAEDLDLLNKYHQSAGQGLDVCVADTLDAIQPTTRFFKIENEFGAYVGFFGFALPIEDQWVLEGFHLRNQFRTPEYKKAFWDLISDTFNNEFYTSTGANNTRAINHLLNNDFTIINTIDYRGKNFVILKSKTI